MLQLFKETVFQNPVFIIKKTKQTVSFSLNTGKQEQLIAFLHGMLGLWEPLRTAHLSCQFHQK